MMPSEVAEQAEASRGIEARPRTVRAPRPWWRSPEAMIVGGLTVIGGLLRLRVAHQPLFADELSTYWIVATHNFSGVLSLMYGTGRIQHAEITPPLFFLASWLTSQLGHAPELVRLPSLIAGTATIPAIYLLARRTVGRRPALLAATVTTLSPFMTYYSSEARSYAVMMLCVTVSTLALLLALDTGRARWWVVFGLAQCAAFYTHYTSIFVLVVQLVWVLWTRPDARRAAMMATIGAVVLFLPWIPGFINDYRSPTTKILSLLSPFNVPYVRQALEHWALGYPYAVPHDGLTAMPGMPALILLGAGLLLTVAGLIRRWRTHLAGGRVLERLPARLLAGARTRPGLMLLLLLSVPIGEALQSAASTHTFGVRNLASAWPALTIVASAIVFWAGRRVGMIVAGLTVIAFLFPAVQMQTARWSRPDYVAAARYIERRAHPGDVVIDGTGVLSPGPLNPLDLYLHPRGPVIREGSPVERDHPYGLLDPVPSMSTAVHRAVARAARHTIYLVRYLKGSVADEPFPRGYQLTQTFTLLNFIQLRVETWSPRNSPSP